MDDRIATTGSTTPRRRPGGRSARVRAAVLDATFETLLELGLRGLSVAEVAARAKVHPTTIYRRWGTRDALVVDAVLDWMVQQAPIPDTGSLDGDLLAFVRDSAALMATPQGGTLLKVAVAVADEPAMDQVRRDYWSRAFGIIGTIFERAAGRGELASGVDSALAGEILLGPLYVRVLMTGEPLDAGFLDGVVSTVLRAVTR